MPRPDGRPTAAERKSLRKQQEVKRAERRQLVLQLYRAGQSQRAIAGELERRNVEGSSVATVNADIRHYLDELHESGLMDAHYAQAMTVEVLRMVRGAVAPRALAGDTQAGRLVMDTAMNEWKVLAPPRQLRTPWGNFTPADEDPPAPADEFTPRDGLDLSRLSAEQLLDYERMLADAGAIEGEYSVVEK